MRKQFFRKARRVVVKIGTSVLTEGHRFEEPRVGALATEIQRIRSSHPGIEFIVVSSGAIGCGMKLLGLKKRPREIERLQAVAAIGQRRLMQLYEDTLGTRGMPTAQILLTWDDLGVRRRYQNTLKTIQEVLKYGAIPIVNENDTVSTEEIRFGDNDELSSMVAILFDADLLILLSDANGFYADFKQGAASRISMIDDLSSSIFDHAYDQKGPLTRGGMKSKLKAIERSVEAGIPCVLADGRTPGVLEGLFEGGDLGTIFLPKITSRKSSKKHWISYVSKSEGTLVVDQGAEEALRVKGKSLLATGIVKIQGHFEAGSALVVKSESGKAFGKGIVNFSSTDLEKIRGLRSDVWAERLGRPCLDEVMHRDNLVLDSRP